MGEYPGMKDVNLMEDGKKTASKGYDIIGKKGYTAFGVASACEKIVDCVLNDKKLVLPVSVRVPGRKCTMQASTEWSRLSQFLDSVCRLAPPMERPCKLRCSLFRLPLLFRFVAQSGRCSSCHCRGVRHILLTLQPASVSTECVVSQRMWQ